jgi:hypothetical protein
MVFSNLWPHGRIDKKNYICSILTCGVSAQNPHHATFGDRFEARTGLTDVDTLADATQPKIFGRAAKLSPQRTVVGIAHRRKADAEPVRLRNECKGSNNWREVATR